MRPTTFDTPISVSHAQDIRDIAEFFGVGVTSGLVSQLTGMSTSSLGRVAAGESRQPAQWEHLAVVAEYVRETRALLMAMSGGQTRPQGDMKIWLAAAQLPTKYGRRYMKDVLADPEMAREALDTLRQATW